MRLNVALNDPSDRYPTATQTSPTVSSLRRSSSWARSIRRVCRYWCGVSPKVSLKQRLKCAGDAWAWRASAGTSSAGSA